MPRAALNTREVQESPREHRTGPRPVGGFRPAQRSIPPQGRVSVPPQREVFRDQEEEVEVEEEERGNGARNSFQPMTKSGYPDRRFRGQRDLPPPPENEGTTRARTGGTIGDVHVTIDGKPDRRFKENRSLSDEEVTRQWLDHMNEKFGKKK